MSKRPYFPFYPGDFLTATSHWTNAEVGAYLRLLCHQWANGAVPVDQRRIANILGVHGESFDEMWAVVGEKFRSDDNSGLRNRRLEEVRADVDEKSAKNKKAADARWRNANAYAKPMPSKSKSKLKSKIKVKPKKEKKAAMPPIPDELDTPEFHSKWAEWLDWRKTYKKPVNPPGAKTSLNQFAKLGPDIAIATIEQSIANDWQGLFPEKLGHKGVTKKSDPRMVVGFDGVARPID